MNKKIWPDGTPRSNGTDCRSLCDFVRESNRIEGILREPTSAEVSEHERFVALPRITIGEVEAFLAIIQPGARLRDRYGLNVRVGQYTPPAGAPEIRLRLEAILADLRHPWITHIAYETLHPFTDGNGRSGRALWLWQMRNAPLNFLHHFYYQTLANVGRSIGEPT